MSGLFQAGYPFGYLLAAVAYGLLFEQLGWRGMFVIGAAPVLLLPFIYFCVEESPVWLAAGRVKRARLCCRYCVATGSCACTWWC
jgi:SHS family lactate transporter-like MFS transporter